MGGFGSAVLEAACDAGIPSTHVRRLGLPDRFVLHAKRNEQLAEVGLDVEGIIRSAIALTQTVGLSSLSELGVDTDSSAITRTVRARNRPRPRCPPRPDRVSVQSIPVVRMFSFGCHRI